MANNEEQKTNDAEEVIKAIASITDRSAAGKFSEEVKEGVDLLGIVKKLSRRNERAARSK